MLTYNDLVKPSVLEQPIYQPGRPIELVALEFGLTPNEVIKLASNENPLGSSPKAIERVMKLVEDCNRYPDSSGYELRKKLSDKYNLDIKNVVLGAGSEGIMSNIMRTFLSSGDKIISSMNSFIGFRVLAEASGYDTDWVPMKDYCYDLEEIENRITEQTKIIYLANPDNPTGTYFNKSTFDSFMNLVPDRVLVILDEAYFEYAQHLEDFPDSMLYRYDNVITLRTFSKAYGLAGLRIGYGFSHETLINNLLKVKVPFDPSFTAQVGGLAALDDDEFMNKTINLNIIEKEKIETKLDELGIERIPSAANFITTHWDTEIKAKTITQKMLDRGIILRHLVSFGWPEHVRISIGLENENENFLQTLEKII